MHGVPILLKNSTKLVYLKERGRVFNSLFVSVRVICSIEMYFGWCLCPIGQKGHLKQGHMIITIIVLTIKFVCMTMSVSKNIRCVVLL